MSETKENLIKISASALLLAVALLITKILIPDLPYYLELLIFLPSYLIISFEVFKETVKKIPKGDFLDEDFLMCIATAGAVAIGDFAEAVTVMIFFTIGETFEEISEKRTDKSLEELLKICPDKARIEKDGVETEIDAKDVEIGDIITVKAGERIPLDGILVFGETTVDTSAVTGESMPKAYKIGDKIFSGCVNLSGLIKIQTSATVENSTASRIIELVKNSTEKKTKQEKFITRFAKIYTPVVVALAVLVAVVPSLFLGNWQKHIYSALSFLVVSCPCALVISVPLSFFGAVGNASKNGILVKGTDSFEAISKLKSVVFDKTGTLTKGSFEVTAVHPSVPSANDISELASAVEKGSNHPVARSIVAHFKGNNRFAPTETKEISGKGIVALVNGKKVFVGNESLMNDEKIEYKSCHHEGTIVHIALEKTYLGHIVISDKIKSEAKPCIDALKQQGIKPIMLTGDNENTAFTVAKEIGIEEYRSSLLPQDKVRITEEIIEKTVGATAFVGDGINDAPVLARADVGIAMGAMGSDSASESADVIIMDDNINKIPLLIKIAQKAVKIAKQNIVFSISVKALVLVLSLFSINGILWYAAFADAGVLVLAVLNSTRTMTVKKDYGNEK